MLPERSRPSARAIRHVLVAVVVTLVAAGALVLAVPRPALAHGDGAARGYTATVTAVTPATDAVSVRVLEGDDRLELTVSGGHVVVVAGYEGEPYLRFTPDGAFRNTRAPATYLEEDRYGRVELPPQADAEGEPAWERVGAADRPYAWHDHRIHWMSESDPPIVAGDPSSAHHVLDWVVPGTLDGNRLEIAGRLDYAPPPGQRFPRVLLAPLALLALAAVALPLVRRRPAIRGPLPRKGTRS